MSKDNYFEAMCHGVCEAKQLDAAILVTVKADRKKDTAAIELHGDGPNKQAVQRLKEIISTALTESIEQFKAEKVKRRPAMRTETFQAIRREIARDPLTERQVAELAGQDRDCLLNSKEAAEMLGVAPATLRNKARRHEILRVKTNGRQCLFRLADVIEYRDKKTI